MISTIIVQHFTASESVNVPGNDRHFSTGRFGRRDGRAAGGRARRGHDGGGDRGDDRPRRPSRRAARPPGRPRGARPRGGPALPGPQRREGPARGRGARRGARGPDRDDVARRPRGLRHRRRGGVRGPRAQGGDVRRARRGVPSRDALPHQHVDALGDRHRRRVPPSRAGGRHALLQPGAADAPRRGRARAADRRRGRGAHRRVPRGPRQARRPHRRRARLHRQPLPGAVRERLHPRPGGRHGHGGVDRQGGRARPRLSDGDLPAPRHRRARHPQGGVAEPLRAAARPALRPAAARRADDQRRAPGPQDRPRLSTTTTKGAEP